MCIDNLPNAYKRQDDHKAQEQMILAATFAGIGFGNAGVHLCHGMSYPISGLNTSYVHPGYNQDKVLVVIISKLASRNLCGTFIACSFRVYSSH